MMNYSINGRFNGMLLLKWRTMQGSSEVDLNLTFPFNNTDLLQTAVAKANWQIGIQCSELLENASRKSIIYEGRHEQANMHMNHIKGDS